MRAAVEEAGYPERMNRPPSRPTPLPRRRPRHRGDDLCLVREPDRAPAQQARRRERDGELRDREGRGALPAGRLAVADLVAAVEAAGYHATVPATTSYDDGAEATRSAAPPARRLGGAARRPSSLMAMVPGAAVPGLAVAVARAGHARRGVGRAAVPPGRLDQRPARRDHDGHPGLARRARRVRLVAVALVFGTAGMIGMTHPFELTPPAPRRRRTSTSRPPRASRPSCWPAATSRPGPSGGRAPRCARWSSWAPATSPCSATAPRSASPSSGSPWATSSWCGRGRRSPPTAPSPTARPPWTRRCSPASPCRSRSVPATRSSAPPSTPVAGWSCAPPASGPTPSWRRWPGSSRRPRAARPPAQRLADRVSAVFVPLVIALVAGDLRHLAAARWRVDRRVHRRGRGADRRLPVRARPGHAGGADGRHRPRRPARHPGQGPRGARAEPPRRHRACSTRPARSPPAG